MSKRKTPDSPFIPPGSTKECPVIIKEDSLAKKWDMEHVITRLDAIQDSIDQILSIILSGAPSDESENSSSDKQ